MEQESNNQNNKNMLVLLFALLVGGAIYFSGNNGGGNGDNNGGGNGGNNGGGNGGNNGGGNGGNNGGGNGGNNGGGNGGNNGGGNGGNNGGGNGGNQVDEYISNKLKEEYGDYFSAGRLQAIYNTQKPKQLNKMMRLQYVYACFAFGNTEGVKVLQNTINALGKNVKVDGKIGPNTISEANRVIQTSSNFHTTFRQQIRDVIDSKHNRGEIDYNTYMIMIQANINLKIAQLEWR